MNTVSFIIIITFASGSAQNYSRMDNLLEYLLNTSRYNKLLRPLHNQSHVMKVNLTQSLTSIEYFDIQSGELMVSGYFEITWIDELLTWDPSLYNGKEVIHLPKEWIWKPEILLSHGEQDSLISNSGFSPVWVSYNGSVRVIPGGSYKSRCDVDTTLFPFDKHMCLFQLYVSNHDTSELMIYSPRGDLDTKLLIENGEWMIENTHAETVTVRPENIETVSVVMSEASFYLKRRSAFEFINTFPPLFLMTYLNTLTCFVRPNSGERLSFAVTLYLALVFASTALVERFPNNSLNMPYLSYTILMLNVINTVSVGWSIFIVHLAYTPANVELPIPEFFRNMVRKSRMCKALKANKVGSVPKSERADDFPESEEFPDEMKEDKLGDNFEMKASSNDISGRELAKILDKMYFIFVFLLFMVINIVLITLFFC